MFELRQKYKDENNDVMQLLVELIMNSLYGEQIRKDIEESYQCKSHAWLMAEYDERVLDCQKINYGNYIVKLKNDEGLRHKVKKVNTMVFTWVLSYYQTVNELRIILSAQLVDFTEVMFIILMRIVYILKTNIGIIR